MDVLLKRLMSCQWIASNDELYVRVTGSRYPILSLSLPHSAATRVFMVSVQISRYDAWCLRWIAIQQHRHSDRPDISSDKVEAWLRIHSQPRPRRQESTRQL
jgi:hypothetical protein